MEEETRRYRPTKNYLEYLPAPSYNAFEVIFMIYGITSIMIDVWLLEIANSMLSDLFLDWNNEKWIWKDASTITNGNVEHEEVSIVSSLKGDINEVYFLSIFLMPCGRFNLCPWNI